jgi:hypothetical protein
MPGHSLRLGIAARKRSQGSGPALGPWPLALSPEPCTVFHVEHLAPADRLLFQNDQARAE